MSHVELKPSVLCVDDDPEVLAGLRLTLQRDHTVFCAPSGLLALTVLERTPNISVVVSDMRMPELDGASFLARVRLNWPDITRILLTGESGRAPAIAAVNEGQVFRFLTKPCRAADFIATVNAAHRHHQIVISERQLLQQTLIGSIQALVDLLSIVNPVAFGRAGRVKRLSLELYKQLGYPASWELEAAALLSQVWYASLPADIVEKLYEGRLLSTQEVSAVTEARKTVSRLLTRIPRLDRVAAILEMATLSDAEPNAIVDDLSEMARVLAAVLEVDSIVSRGETPLAALAILKGSRRQYTKVLLEALSWVTGDTSRIPTIKEIALRDVKQGMILLTDVRLENGALLVSRDYEISETFIQRLANYKPALLNTTVRVGLARTIPDDSG